MSKVLSLAVCLFPDVTVLDYQGAVELFGFLSSEKIQSRLPPPAYVFDVTYLYHTLEPVEVCSGPRVLPTRTYGDVKCDEQFDIIFIPGGPRPSPDIVPPVLLEFVKQQARLAKYIITVCTGSWVLAGTGLLDGKCATTNKASFLVVKAATSKAITWVPKARWVVDGKIWTSSGVTAGMDMANAFLIHLVGDDITRTIRNIVELRAVNQGEDEFAEVHGLV